MLCVVQSAIHFGGRRVEPGEVVDLPRDAFDRMARLGHVVAHKPAEPLQPAPELPEPTEEPTAETAAEQPPEAPSAPAPRRRKRR